MKRLLLGALLCATGTGLSACADRHDGAAPDGGANAPADANDEQVLIPSGTCGVSRRMRLDAGGVGFSLARLADGFAFGPWIANGYTFFEPRWFWIADGKQAPISATWQRTPDLVLGALPVLTPSGRVRALVATSLTSLNSVEAVSVQSIGEDGSGAAHVVGEHFRRGTEYLAVATSFDGQRGLFATGHVIFFEPRAFLLDSQGRRVGNAATFVGITSFTCLTATPTQHAGALSVVTPEPTPTLHVLELSADGSAARESTMPVDEPCPLLQAASTGLLVLQRVSGQVLTHRLNQGSATALGSPVSLAELGDSPRWLAEANGGLLMLARHAEGARIALTSNGAVSWIPGDLPSGTVVPSEPGTLFLHVSQLNDAGTGFAHELVQVECNLP